VLTLFITVLTFCFLINSQWVVNYISECFLKYYEALSILTKIIVNWRCTCYIVSKKTNNTKSN
jgi:hypothetical protein